jgi:hypothetical protein
MVGTVQLIKFRYLLIIAQHLLARHCFNILYITTYDRIISVKTNENEERALEGELWHSGLTIHIGK